MSDAFSDVGDREYRIVDLTVRYWIEHGLNKNHQSPYTHDERLLKQAYREYVDIVGDSDTKYVPKHMKITS